MIPRTYDFILPKFHFILPKFHLSAPWGIFVCYLEICDFLCRGLALGTSGSSGSSAPSDSSASGSSSASSGTSAPSEARTSNL